MDIEIYRLAPLAAEFCEHLDAVLDRDAAGDHHIHCEGEVDEK